MDDGLRLQWHQVRDRLVAKRLLLPPQASLSLRIPGRDEMWFGGAGEDAPRRLAWGGMSGCVHGAVYAARGDVGAVAVGGGAWGLLLADFGGRMPEVFDEQARHLGRMGPRVADAQGLPAALAAGGNVQLVQGDPVCLGTTATRLALNAELFEKCAKAYVLAAASGGRVRALPWLVRYVANGRLLKDERRARERLMQGLLPEESKGY